MRELEHPLDIQVEVTEGCNHACFYCYNSRRRQGTEASGRDMTRDSAERLARVIVETVRPFQVTITGGEPVRNEPAILGLAKPLAAAGMFLSINTNATLWTEAVLHRLLAAADLRKLGFVVSMPSLDPALFREITGRDPLDHALAGVDMILATGASLLANMVVHRRNLGDVYATAAALSERGVRAFAATPAVPPSLPTEEACDYALDAAELAELFTTLARIEAELGLRVDALEPIPLCVFANEPEVAAQYLKLGRRCSAGRSTLSIDCTGGVRACSHSPLVEGNLLNEPFEEIWQTLRPYRLNAHVPDSCRDCAAFPRCHGGCRFYALVDGESLSKPDPRMTGPIAAIDPPTRSRGEFRSTLRHQVNPLTIYREEGDGRLAFFNGSFQRTLFLNRPQAELVLLLISLEEFRPADLVRGAGQGLETKAGSLFDLLWQKGYLLQVAS